MASRHLKNIDDEEYSPLLLAACITSKDYRDAFKILRDQGCELITNKFYYDDTKAICTGLENHGTKELNLMAYIAIGEYLANVGSGAGMSTYLNEIFHILVELKNRS
ncbi:hypothetical protein RI534_12900 [Aeromonas allosaccharophila]|uniref:hypothetical protein n=1 Tax=Aeromonas allosaccharophila TaxID=656 RepID=UPI00342694CB